jgi:hypothetical protein
MDIDRGALADAVESADTLFEQLGILREIEKHEVMRKLEVPSLAADLRAEQDARALVVGEECGIAIALKQREALMENAAVYLYRALDARGDFLDEFARAADEQNLGLAKFAQCGGEPADERVFRRRIWLDAKQAGMALAGWESLNDGTGVPKHDATGAEFIEEVCHKALTGGFIACGEFSGVLLDAW